MQVVHAKCVCSGSCIESAYLTAAAHHAEKRHDERVILELASDGRIYHHIMRVAPTGSTK